MHDHHHDHHHHHHHDALEPAADAGNARRVTIALVLTASFMVAEVVGGIVSGSLALLADAGHMLTDAASLALALVAFRLARRPADAARSYGWHRTQVLAAFVNALSLLVIVGWITVEAVLRLLEPQPVLGGTMLAVAVGGLVVNIAAFAVLHGGDRTNVNLRGAALHVLGDLLGSVAAVAAAVVILWTGWTPIDPILSLAVALLILRTTLPLLKRTGHILLEGSPEGLDVGRLGDHIARTVDGVEEVHHVHAWMLTPERNLVTLHARVRPGSDDGLVLRRIHEELRSRFGVGHATVQIERDEPCPAPGCPPGRVAAAATTSPHSCTH
ncbi:cation diffusion facilitator family transporter [Caenispirillum bisanense]|uniref:cation diffusion facilitator family transporter n=1 Tax=Caenispirillum bisanense TaxID=414052 RepID=UPI0031DD59B7